MTADPKGTKSGAFFIDGDHACAEGAIAAGCRFVAGYPITPSTEVVERIAERFPLIGGMFIQMEDEIASSIAIQGAVWGGKKAMTVTSGPGFSLMMEHIGLAAMTETPCVFVDVQRGGPSTGLPTLPGQADMMQARWGSHGDYGIIALCPNSPQESFDLTIKAFNLSETYRVPVLLMLDECVGHMTERVVIPPAEEIEVVERRYWDGPQGRIPPLQARPEQGPAHGQGRRRLQRPRDRPDPRRAGLSGHDRGRPGKARPEARGQDPAQRRRDRRVPGGRNRGRRHRRRLLRDHLAGGHPGHRAGAQGGAEGRPSPAHHRLAVSGQADPGAVDACVGCFVVPEINYGQMVREVERCVAGRTNVERVSHGGGTVHDPKDIYAKLMSCGKE